MTNHLTKLVEISRFYGRDPNFVLAGGGNTSYKNEEQLYIKGSGTSLAGIAPENFICLDRNVLNRLWAKDFPEDPEEREAQVLQSVMAAIAPGQEGKRPSVETSLHNFFPQRFVVHTHPALLNGLSCSKEGADRAAQIFGKDILWIPTVIPGYILAATVKGLMASYRQDQGREADILIMQNHGLLVAGDTIAEVKLKTDRLIEKLEDQIQRRPDFSPADYNREQAVQLAPALRMLLMEAGPGQRSIVVSACNHEIAALVRNRKTFSLISTSYSPDHIVYCAHEPLFVDRAATLEEQYQFVNREVAQYVEKYRQKPRIIAVEGLGVFCWGSSKKTADTALALFLDAVKVKVYAESFGGAQAMPPEQVDFIRSWEVEAFRQKVHGAASGRGRIQDKIALVTGAAQSFGLGIAQILAKEGANIVLADLNVRKAEEEAGILGHIHGPGKALAVAVDVADETAVQKMIEDTVLNYGGLDIFINNAGIVRAGGLEDMDLKSLELMSRVNYSAYFLCTKYASRTMKIQQQFLPEYYTDIIQINSKSGLSGSKRNFAYSGSKFGTIGLTQSFALELVENRIKVNSVCPGNFFDGPLWSDPENGLFKLYLEAGKVPGAKNAEDVRRYYESRVPMGRGCTPVDVARAILYLIDQTYETGQALPVTGGQVMLK